MMTKQQTALERIKKGIADYSYEQAVIIRLLNKRNTFTSTEFDKWFINREILKKSRYRKFRIGSGVSGDSFILGIGINGNTMWAEWLDLIQKMMIIGIIKTTTNKNNEVVYSLKND